MTEKFTISYQFSLPPKGQFSPPAFQPAAKPMDWLTFTAWLWLLVVSVVCALSIWAQMQIGLNNA
jgi:hypothetical protein